MALRTVDGAVSAAQGKGREIVVKFCRLPRIVVVANLAIFGKIARNVIWIGWALKVGLMTGEAIGRSAGETIVHVALTAIDCCVYAEQGKARFIVIIRRRPPNICVVANLAIFGKITGNVIRIGRALKIVLMAGKTIFRRAGKTAINVAFRTFGSRMGAHQRKTGSAVIEALAAKSCDLPAGNRAVMALLAAH